MSINISRAVKRLLVSKDDSKLREELDKCQSIFLQICALNAISQNSDNLSEMPKSYDWVTSLFMGSPDSEVVTHARKILFSTDGVLLSEDLKMMLHKSIKTHLEQHPTDRYWLVALKNLDYSEFEDRLISLVENGEHPVIKDLSAEIDSTTLLDKVRMVNERLLLTDSLLWLLEKSVSRPEDWHVQFLQRSFPALDVAIQERVARVLTGWNTTAEDLIKDSKSALVAAQLGAPCCKTCSFYANNSYFRCAPDPTASYPVDEANNCREFTPKDD